MPVGLAGPPEAIQRISGAFAANAPGAFVFTSYACEDQARQALSTRGVDGVVTLGPRGPRLIVAGAEEMASRALGHDPSL